MLGTTESEVINCSTANNSSIMTDSHSPLLSSSPCGRRRVIFPELHQQQTTPISPHKYDGGTNDPSTSTDEKETQEDSSSSPTTAVATTAQCSLSELEFYSTLPSIDPRSSPVLVDRSSASSPAPVPSPLPSPKTPLSSSRRKIFEFASSPQLPTPFRRSPSILKPTSYPRLDSIPSLASSSGGDDEQNAGVRGTNSRGSKVIFHSQVSSRDFERSQEELQATWWSSTDMEIFQITAMAKVFHMGGATDSDGHPKKALFTHPALAA